ncbi:MAG: prepilin-type N-terminal cleavage/methylation domain-containing protein [Puniceicoccales bacterium]|nr:prepilin-type N-terminal cleavage/methylation domain-containing protein [Puniceicoccales bacterium]
MGRKGFSLLEMVLALALGGSVLLASVSLMTTFVELWERETKPDWEIEAQIVAKKFLSNSLQEAYIRLQGMYPDKKGDPTEPQPYWRDSDPQPGTFYLYWQNHNTPPFIDNPQGRFIEYHLVHDHKKHRVQLHHRLLPLDYRQQLPPAQHVTLFRKCSYFGYAYYTFDGDSWNITLEPKQDQQGRNKLPDGFHFEFEDKTQLFVYLKKHSHFPFKAPEPPKPSNLPDPTRGGGGGGGSGGGGHGGTQGQGNQTQPGNNPLQNPTTASQSMNPRSAAPKRRS